MRPNALCGGGGIGTLSATPPPALFQGPIKVSDTPRNMTRRDPLRTLRGRRIHLLWITSADPQTHVLRASQKRKLGPEGPPSTQTHFLPPSIQAKTPFPGGHPVLHRSLTLTVTQKRSSHGRAGWDSKSGLGAFMEGSESEMGGIESTPTFTCSRTPRAVHCGRGVLPKETPGAMPIPHTNRGDKRVGGGGQDCPRGPHLGVYPPLGALLVADGHNFETK